MRNKKYRPVKLWLILLSLCTIGTVASVFINGWQQIALSCCTGLIALITILTFTYYFEVKDDSIIILHGLSSFNRKYSSSFKRRVILLNDINSLDMADNGRAIIINLTGGDAIQFSISGYFKRNEIIRLVYEVKAQLEVINKDN